MNYNRKTLYYDYLKIFPETKLLWDKDNPVNFKRYSYMFIEDLHSHLFPYLPNLQLKLKKENKELNTKIMQCFHGYRRFDLINFLRDSLSQILYFGGRSFEIYYDEEQNIEILDFPFISLRKTLFTRKFYQYVPAKKIKQDDEDHSFDDNISSFDYSKNRIYLNEDDLFIMTIPKKLAKDMPLITNSMDNISDGLNLMSKFTQIDNNGNMLYPLVQLEDFRRKERLALSKICKDISWKARDCSSEFRTEYYNIYLLLKFHRFITELRNDLISQFNVFVRKICKHFDYEENYFECDGLLTIQDIDNLIDDLFNNRKTFMEILDIIFYKDKKMETV